MFKELDDIDLLAGIIKPDYAEIEVHYEIISHSKTMEDSILKIYPRISGSYIEFTLGNMSDVGVRVVKVENNSVIFELLPIDENKKIEDCTFLLIPTEYQYNNNSYQFIIKNNEEIIFNSSNDPAHYIFGQTYKIKINYIKYGQMLEL